MSFRPAKRSRQMLEAAPIPIQKESYPSRRRLARRFRPGLSKPLSFGLPPQFTCKLKYSVYLDVNPAANSYQVYKFGANCLFDPEIALGGHQPNPFDQLMAFYKKSTVIGSKITVTPMRSVGGAGGTPLQFGIVTSSDGDANVLLSTPDAYNESPLAKNKLKTSNSDGGTNGRNNQVDWQTATYSMKRQFPGMTISDDSMFNTTSANPTDITYYECLFYNIFGNDPNACVTQFTIEYIATFFELLPVASS